MSCNCGQPNVRQYGRSIVEARRAPEVYGRIAGTPLPPAFLHSFRKELALSGNLLDLVLQPNLTPVDAGPPPSTTDIDSQYRFLTALRAQLRAYAPSSPPKWDSWVPLIGRTQRVRGGSDTPTMRVINDDVRIADGSMGLLGFSMVTQLQNLPAEKWVAQEVAWWEYGLHPDCITVTWEHGIIREAFFTDENGNTPLDADPYYPQTWPEDERDREFDTHSAFVRVGKNACDLCRYFHIRLVRFWPLCKPAIDVGSAKYAMLNQWADGIGCLHTTKNHGDLGWACTGRPYVYAIRFYWNTCDCPIPTLREPDDPSPRLREPTDPPPGGTGTAARMEQQRPIVVVGPARELGGVPLVPGSPPISNPTEVLPGTTAWPLPPGAPRPPIGGGVPTTPGELPPSLPFFPPDFPYPPGSQPPSPFRPKEPSGQRPAGSR